MLPMSVAWSSFGKLTIGPIAYRREGVTGIHSAGEMYNYDCLVCLVNVCIPYLHCMLFTVFAVLYSWKAGM